MAQPSFEEFKRLVGDSAIPHWHPKCIEIEWDVELLEKLFNRITRPDWTPVEQGLPHYSGGAFSETMHLTCKREGRVYRTEGCYDFRNNRWSIAGVVAWLPFPKPYEAPDE